ncbi:MAG TPA: sugar ABC transporter ATP-binding protein [Streptosporangiaceae bacterium]|nr:sugar ABC transporter ATP-binding protein [Streptosporangiaceae bacterium]
MTLVGAHVEVRSLRKSFGGTVALDDVSLDIRPGEIHALLGHNGAGKSTVIRCLGGGISPDAGEIAINGTAYRRLAPREAMSAGIAVIYQNLGLISALTTAENIFLGTELRKFAILSDRRAQNQAAERELAQFQPDFTATTPVDRLSIAEQQLVAIAKALHRRATLLVLDEPTAALSDAEATALGSRLRELRDQGLSILYVTHLLKEVFDLTDRVTVMRDGQVILSARTSKTSSEGIVEAIAGRRPQVPRPAPKPPGEPILGVNRLAGDRFGPISFELRAGEVVAIFGPLGSGRTELLEAIFGRRPAVAGSITLGRFHGRFSRPDQAIRHGLALVPAERIKQGLLQPLSNLDNALLPSFRKISRSGLRGFRSEARIYADVAASLGIRPPDPAVPVRSLSGGNQQKVMLARWLNRAQHASVLLLDEPTQGIDVGVRNELYSLLRGVVAAHGKAVLITSSDPEEVVSVADRALILTRGKTVAEIPRAQLSEQALLAAINV